MSTIHVRNINGSSKKWQYPKCCCLTWIEHWDNNSSYYLPKQCPVCGQAPTTSNPMVGGHVQKVVPRNGSYVLSDDQTVYIAPICGSCNKDPDLVFEIDSDYLVPAAADRCKVKF